MALLTRPTKKNSLKMCKRTLKSTSTILRAFSVKIDKKYVDYPSVGVGALSQPLKYSRRNPNFSSYIYITANFKNLSQNF